MKLKIATTGLSGLIGTRLQEILKERVEFVEIKKEEVDISNKESVLAYFSHIEADILLHLAAFTNVDACETERETAYLTNVVGTKNLYDAAQEKGMKFIFMSTGFVFDGTNPPYFEDSQPNPISYYGETKLEAENIVSEKGMIVRIDYPYGSKTEQKKDMVVTILDILRDKKPLKGIVDQIFTPTYIDDLAEELFYLIHSFSPGIYHVVGSDSLSGMQIIETIGSVMEIDTSWVEKTTYDEFYIGKARRPKSNILKSHQTSHHHMKSFREGLEDYKHRL